MQTYPSISIIMPLYNSAAHLSLALESILRQTFSDWELLIMDDGSTDDGLEIVRQYDDDRIKLVSDGTNRGQSYRYNQAAQLAKGEYIAIMHSDDIAREDRLEKQYHFLTKHPEIGLVASKAKLMYGDNPASWLSFGIDRPYDYLNIYRFFNCPFIHPTAMMRASVLKGLKYDGHFFTTEDYELWTRLMEKHPIAILNEPLLSYRIHNQKISRRKKDLQLEEVKEICRLQFKRIGIEFEEQDLDIHLLISDSYLDPIHISELEHIKRWLNRLYIELKGLKIYETATLDHVFNDVWFLCIKKTKGQKWQAIQTYFKAQMSFPVNHRTKRLPRLLGPAIIGEKMTRSITSWMGS